MTEEVWNRCCLREKKFFPSNKSFVEKLCLLGLENFSDLDEVSKIFSMELTADCLIGEDLPELVSDWKSRNRRLPSQLIRISADLRISSMKILWELSF
jgi:hypothetical protein